MRIWDENDGERFTVIAAGIFASFFLAITGFSGFTGDGLGPLKTAFFIDFAFGNAVAIAFLVTSRTFVLAAFNTCKGGFIAGLFFAAGLFDTPYRTAICIKSASLYAGIRTPCFCLAGIFAFDTGMLCFVADRIGRTRFDGMDGTTFFVGCAVVNAFSRALKFFHTDVRTIGYTL